MPNPKSKKSIAEILSAFAAGDNTSVKYVYKTISPALLRIVDDKQFEEFVTLIRRRLGDSRFDLYLKLSPKFTARQMQKDKSLLLNRLYAPIKRDVTEALNLLDAGVVPALNQMTANANNLSAWLRSAGSRDGLTERAKLCYIYKALELNKREILGIERLLLSAMELDDKIKFDKNTGKLFPEILLSKFPFAQIEKLAYLHRGEAREAETLRKQTAQLQASLDRSAADCAHFRGELELLRTQIAAQKETIERLERERSELSSKLAAAGDRLEYETHKYEMDGRLSKIAFAENLKRRLSIEIEGINTTLKHVEDPDKSRILRRIANIEEILSTEEG